MKETPFFWRTPPWQEVQFWLKIGRISRLKSTRSRGEEALTCNQPHAAPIATTRRATSPKLRTLGCEAFTAPGPLNRSLRQKHVQHIPRLGADPKIRMGVGKQHRAIAAQDVGCRQR